MLKLAIAIAMTIFAGTATAISTAVSAVAAPFVLFGVFILSIASLRAVKTALE